MTTATPRQFINVDLVLEHKGLKRIVPAALDTGAEVYIAMDKSDAEALKLPPGKEVMHTGIGGGQIGFETVVDLASIGGAPECILARVPISVLDLDINGVRALVGEHFMRLLGMKLDITREGVKIACAKGPGHIIEVGAGDWKSFVGFGLAAGIILVLGTVAIGESKR